MALIRLNGIMSLLIFCFGNLSAIDLPFTSRNPEVAVRPGGVTFTENKGQIHDQNYKPRPDVLFGGYANGMVFHLRSSGISYQLERVDTWRKQDSSFGRRNVGAQIMGRSMPDKITNYRLDINWLRCNKNFKIIPGDAEPGFANYYTAACPDGVFNVKSYTGVRYKHFYDGIDLHYYDKNGVLKYDFIVAPGADVGQIQLEVGGAVRIHLEHDGSVTIQTPLGKISEGTPVVFQNGRQVPARWHLEENILSFLVDGYDISAPLIIDPAVRVWGTYYGAGIADQATDIASDSLGSIYIVGQTKSTGTIIATSGSHQNIFGGGLGFDSYLAKFNAGGVRQWGTYYGGNHDDVSWGVCVDKSNNVIMTGWTASSGMSTPGVHQTTKNLQYDAFLVKFNSGGIRQWGTYFGGNDVEQPLSCCSDRSGNIFITGNTTSTNGIATAGCHQPAHSGSNQDAFLAKFTASGALLWATYYGGNGNLETAWRCSTDTSGSVYIAGLTRSTNSSAFTTASSHQQLFGGGNFDGFIAKFSSGGSRLWGTFVGSSAQDYLMDCAVSDSGYLYVIGQSYGQSSNVSSPGSYQASNSGVDALLMKFDENGVRKWGTYYGFAPGNSIGAGVAVDPAENIYIAGYTGYTGTAFATPGEYQATPGGGPTDGFIARFTSGNGFRVWSTYYGGGGDDHLNRIAVNDYGSIYVVGDTESPSGIATPGSHQPAFIGGSGQSGFVVKFNDCVPVIPVNTTTSTPIICDGNTATLTVSHPAGGTINWYSTSTGTTVIGTGSVFQVPQLSAGHYTFYAEASLSCTAASLRLPLTLTVQSRPAIVVNSGSICTGQQFTLITTGASSYTFSSGTNVVSPSVTTTFSVTGTSSVGCESTQPAIATVTVIPAPAFVINGPEEICKGTNGLLSVSGAATYTWNTGNTSPLISISPSVTTVYSVSGQNAHGCESAGSKTVTVKPIASLSASNVTTCASAPVILLVNANPSADSYTWFPGSFSGTSATLNPASTTVYTIAASLNGCESASTVTVTVVESMQPVISFSYATHCSERITAVPIFGNGFTSGGSYSISPSLPMSPSDGNVAIHNALPGSYTVSYHLPASGCTLSGTGAAVLNITEPQKLTLAHEVKMEAGTSVTLSANGASSYTWSPSQWLSCDDCSSPVASPPATTKFCVKSPNDACIAETCVLVIVEDAGVCSAGGLTVPKAFTPNNDGRNDFLQFDGWQKCVTSFHIFIYDRWGEKVFESSDPDFKWDGTYNGKPLTGDVLVFVAQATLGDGTSTERKGNITLIR